MKIEKLVSWTPQQRIVCQQFEPPAHVAKMVNKQLHGLMWLGVHRSEQKLTGFHLHTKFLCEFAFQTRLR